LGVAEEDGCAAVVSTKPGCAHLLNLPLLRCEVWAWSKLGKHAYDQVCGRDGCV